MGSVLKPRNRVLFVRISQDEFEKLTELCRLAGARSLSDLARSALQRMAASHAARPLPADRVTTEELFVELSNTLKQLSALLAEHSNGRS